MAAASFLKKLHPAGLSSWEGRRTSGSRVSVSHILTISVLPQLNLLFAQSDLFFSATFLHSLLQGYFIWDEQHLSLKGVVCFLFVCLVFVLFCFLVIETLRRILYVGCLRFFPDGSSELLPWNIPACFVPHSNASLTPIVFSLFCWNKTAFQGKSLIFITYFPKQRIHHLLCLWNDIGNKHTIIRSD